jgi:hypothetical protein
MHVYVFSFEFGFDVSNIFVHILFQLKSMLDLGNPHFLIVIRLNVIGIEPSTLELRVSTQKRFGGFLGFEMCLRLGSLLKCWSFVIKGLRFVIAFLEHLRTFIHGYRVDRMIFSAIRSSRKMSSIGSQFHRLRLLADWDLIILLQNKGITDSHQQKL